MLAFLQRYILEKAGLTLGASGVYSGPFVEQTFRSYDELWHSSEEDGNGFDIMQSFL